MASNPILSPFEQSPRTAALQMVIGGALAALAIVALLHRDPRTASPTSLLVVALLVCAGAYLIRRGAPVIAAHRFATRSARAIQRNLKRTWVLERPKGQPLPVVVLTSPDEQRWVILIHTLPRVQIRRAFGGLGRQRLFLGRHEGELAGTAQAAAAAFGGHPIVWLPAVPGKGGLFEMDSGIPIAAGKVRALLDSIDARKTWSLF
ncbi:MULTISPECIES: hypothetical protein [unclassified Burkholderia]|uniref:hypothetical protein n=1 Tax=unclassified Burkholderia TaxID=2613784 RepID=UPI000F5FA2DF|nr:MULTISPECIES: hypothetical protein [unclassified Burkholderia]